MRLGYLLLIVALLVATLFFYGTFNNKSKESYYDNGSLKVSFPLVNNKVHGEVVEYYQDGKVKSRVKFVEGKQHGEALFYYPNKELKKETYFINGVQQDTLKVYYSNGNLQELSFLKDGVKEGVFEDYYENGKLKSKGLAKDNRRNGEFLFYSPLGVLEHKDYFIDGDLVSRITENEEGDLKYHNRSFNYSFSIPVKFSKSEEKYDYVVFTERHKSDGFISSINVLTRMLEDEVTSKDFINKELESIKGVTSDFNLLSRKSLVNHEGAIVKYIAKFNNFDVKVITSFLDLGDHICIITYMAEKNKFSNHVTAYNNVLNTFKNNKD